MNYISRIQANRFKGILILLLFAILTLVSMTTDAKSLRCGGNSDMQGTSTVQTIR